MDYSSDCCDARTLNGICEKCGDNCTPVLNIQDGEHTPTPWYLDEDGGSSIMAKFLEKEMQITCMSPTKFCGQLTVEEEEYSEAFEKTTKHNAAHIVKCVNVHDELVQQLEWIVEQYIEECCSCDGTGEPQAGDYERCSRCHGQGEVVRDSIVCETGTFKKLLAKARGK